MSLTSSGCRMIFDGVPYVDLVSHIRRRSVLGARPSVTLSPIASSAGCVGHYLSTLLAATACGGGVCSTPTPLVVSVRSDDRSTSTPLTVFARGGD